LPLLWKLLDRTGQPRP